MANYNKGKYIEKAIRSVLAQTETDWELLVLDDASTDGSGAVMNKFQNDPRIKTIFNKKNQGKIAALAKMVAEAEGEIMVEVDSDDYIEKETLERIRKIYDNKPDVGYVYTQCYYCDENLQPRHLGFSAPIPEGKSNLHCNCVVAMRSFRKADYQKTAGYDEDCLYAEDIDLTLKMEEVTNLHFLDEPLYYYRVLPRSQTHSFRNSRINRSSTALAKLNAYQRRLGTGIPNLNKAEISEVLFFGIIISVLAGRFWLAGKFVKNLFSIHPFFLFDPRFYIQIGRKAKKIIKLKKEKPLLKI